MAGRFIIARDADGAYRFVLRAGNGEVIAVSERYATKASALRGVDAVRRVAPEALVTDES